MSALSHAAQSVVDGIERRVRAQYPGQDDVSMADILRCDSSLIRAYAVGYRVRVRNERTGEVRTGIVTRSLGWRPLLLLKHRANSIGSSDVLDATDRVIAIQRGRRYLSTRSER